MKLLDNKINAPSATQTAKELLDTTPLIMRTIRKLMRAQTELDLSVPQFRSLGFLHRHPGSGLQDVADHAGLKAPTMSKMIDTLVGRGLVERLTPPHDRRRVTLHLTESGEDLWQQARLATHEHLRQQLSTLSDEDLLLIDQAMNLLKPLFAKPDANERKDEPLS